MARLYRYATNVRFCINYSDRISQAKTFSAQGEPAAKTFQLVFDCAQNIKNNKKNSFLLR